jgi:hypothetical protein
VVAVRALLWSNKRNPAIPLQIGIRHGAAQPVGRYSAMETGGRVSQLKCLL